MRLHLILPRVEPTEIEPPATCPYEGCDGTSFRFRQAVEKPLRDTEYDRVSAHRYECLKCRRTFRGYPRGVSRAQTSLRVKGLAVTLYVFVGAQLWGGLAGVGGLGGLPVQKSGV